jgi:hypothetical protein
VDLKADVVVWVWCGGGFAGGADVVDARVGDHGDACHFQVVEAVVPVGRGLADGQVVGVTEACCSELFVQSPPERGVLVVPGGVVVVVLGVVVAGPDESPRVHEF